jgi:hypothetical protein
MAPRLRSRLILGNAFPGPQDPGNRLPDWNFRSWLRLDASQHTFTRRFDLHHRFVSLNFKQRLALADSVAFLLQPGNELAGFLRHFESGHDNADGHSGLGGLNLAV